MVANPFVSTFISTAPVGATGAGFGVPALLSYNADGFGSERGRLYSGYDEVIADFPSTSGPEALWAAAVFGQAGKKPPSVAILRGALKPTMVYAMGANAVTPGDTYDITVEGDGVTTTEIAITLPATNVTISAVANASETFTAAAHGMVTGDGPYRLTNSGGGLPSGTSVDTDYWIIKLTADTFQLATSYANAIAETELLISSDGTGTHTVNRTSNDVLMALIKDRANSVVGKNYAVAQVTGAGETDTLTWTASAAGEWFSVTVGDPALLALALTHTDPGVATDLAAIHTSGPAYYELQTAYNSYAYVSAAAAWIEANGNGQRRRTYRADTCDTAALTASVGAAGNDVGDRIHTLAYTRTKVEYHGRPAAFLGARHAGRTLPLDPGKVVAAHKPLAGIAATTLTSTWYANLIAKNVGGYASFETGTAATFLGKMASGEWWDTVRNDDYVNDQIRVALYNVDLQNNIVPFNDGGITLKASALEGVLKDAVDKNIYTDVVVSPPLAADVSSANRTARRLPIPWSATRVGAVIYTDATGTVS